MRRAKAAPLALALALAGTGAFSLDWPLAPPRVAATFGTQAQGRTIAGLALAAEEGLVRAAEQGELAYILEEGSHPAGLPSTLGSFVVIEHANGIAGVYSHLAPRSASPRLRAMKAGEALGKPGSTGWLEGPGILFQLFDRRAGAWVNPMLLLTPLADDKSPVIRSLALSRAGKTYVLGDAAAVPQGTYLFSVDVADPSDSPWTVGPLAPYRVRLAVDGVEVAMDVFDVARCRDGRLELFAGSPVRADRLRTKEGRLALAERLLARGKVVVEARVEDIAGNRRSASWTLVVE
jgi:hypothetical protein